VDDVTNMLDVTSSGQTRLVAMTQKLAALLSTDVSNVEILSMVNAVNSPGNVDVTFSAHGSPYYTPEKLNSIVWMNRNSVSR
jgi:hypothetical protein